jgi:hypothetical protein
LRSIHLCPERTEGKPLEKIGRLEQQVNKGFSKKQARIFLKGDLSDILGKGRGK